MSEYPTREKYFANKFCRLLTKSAAAQELGPEACWLLTVVVHQEHAKYYSGPVTYYNEQLMPLAGFGGRGRLVRARNKAVSAGWLHYEQGGKGVPGKYWVTVPNTLQVLPDGPCDESDSVLIQDGNNSRFRSDSGRQADCNRTASGLQPDGKRAPYKPIPIPDSKEPPNGDSPPKQVWDGDAWPLLSGSLYRLPLETYQRYRATYSWDIDPELRKSAQWCREHKPQRSKTARGMQSRITGWLNRTDDRRRTSGNGQAFEDNLPLLGPASEL